MKTQLGKLSLNLPLADLVQHHQKDGMELLPITLAHILELEQLPPHHKDPFDRLLIAQSRVESVAIVSKDAIFQHYNSQIIWGFLRK